MNKDSFFLKTKKTLIKQGRPLLMVIFIVSIICAYGFSSLKEKSLSYDFDHAYFLQFITKAFDEKSAKVITTPPIGANMFGLGSFECSRGFFKSLHLEPVKYLQSIVYEIIPSSSFVYFFSIALYFLPLLYLFFLYRKIEEKDKALYLLVGFFYAAFPNAMMSATFDLRPFSFLAPSMLMLFLAIESRRPFYEILLFFNLLFFAREEALIFSILFIVYYYIKNSFDKKTISLVVNWLFWAIFTFTYLMWIGYGFTDKSLLRFDKLIYFLKEAAPYLIIIFGLILFATIKIVKQKIDNGKISAFLKQSGFWIFSLLGLVVPTFFGALKKAPSPRNFLQLFYFPRFNLFIPVVVLMFLVISYRRIKNESQKKYLIVSFLIFATISFIMNFLPIQGSPYLEAKNMQKKIHSVDPVWRIRETTDKYNTKILISEDLASAFYDYEHLDLFPNSSPIPFGLERKDEDFRGYPKNEDYLLDLIDNEIDYILVSKSFKKEMQPLLDKLSGSITEMEESSNHYFFYKVIK